MPGTGEYQQQIRFALNRLRAQNGQFIFERLCRELARVTICRDVLPATGPVSAGGDQGRDFETFASAVPERVREVGAGLGIRDGDAIAFACTLQQEQLRPKILGDVAKVVGSGSPVSWVVAYCEVDVPVAARHEIERQATERHGIRLVIFDGNAIADLLAHRVGELGSVVAECLQVSPTGSGPRVPRDLPRAPLRFVNRERELSALDRIAGDVLDAKGPRVAVLAGMHGVGKSTIGSWWAHHNRDRFDGGDLFGDFSKRRHGASVEVGELLADFLRQLGTPDIAIPSGFGDRQRLFQRLTTGKRLLLLLDDVDQPAQVLSVIPAGAGSMVIVTTNYHLEELFAEGAELVELDPLDPETSQRLLEEMAGVERVRAEPDNVSELIRLCGGLPIALCVCGGRLAADRARTVGWVVNRVRLAPRRLAALSGTGSFAVEGVFDFAYDDLPARAALQYRRLGLHPGPDLAGSAAAALAGVSAEEAMELLEVLRGAYLIEMPSLDRFRLHDLVRQHTVACVVRDDTSQDRDDAVRRLVDWYYAAVQAADWAVVADRLRLTDALKVTAENVPVFETARAAFDWFAIERANVIAIVRVAFDREWDDRVWQFAEALWPLCASHKHFSEWIASHEMAVAASLRLGDPAVEARVRSQLARAYAEQGDAAQARREMRAALDAAAVCDNQLLQASVTEFSGVCELRLDAAADALDAFVEARRQFAACGYPRGVMLQELYSGSALIRLGRHSEALEALDVAREGLTAAGDEISVGRALVRRSEALRHLGRLVEACAAVDEALEIMTRFGIRFEQAEALEMLAALADDANSLDEARRHRQEAYRIYQELGHPRADDVFVLLNKAV